MATPSTNYSAAGTQFSIPASETEQTDITAFMINALAALEGHDHTSTRGLAVGRLAASVAGNPTFAGNVAVSGTLTVPSLTVTSSLAVGGGLSFTSTGQRLTGDFSNATLSNRTMFQTSTTNGATAVSAIPNGSSTTASLTAYNAADPSNAGAVRLTAAGTQARLLTSAAGTGTEPATIELAAALGTLVSIATATGVPTLCAVTATPAGGSTSARLLLGTTAGFGIYYGSGAPTVSAAQGSLYLRSDGSSTSTRMYVNTNGATTWTAVTTAA